MAEVADPPGPRPDRGVLGAGRDHAGVVDRPAQHQRPPGIRERLVRPGRERLVEPPGRGVASPRAPQRGPPPRGRPPPPPPWASRPGYPRPPPAGGARPCPPGRL